MNIAILGDSHDHYDNLRKAVAVANDNQCGLMLHTGDLGAPKNCIEILEGFVGKVIMVLGNNDHEIVGLMRNTCSENNFELVKTAKGGDSYEEEVAGLRIFMHHYPRMAELAALSGEFDVCIHGHSHRYRLEEFGSTTLVNPGSVIGGKEPASLVVLCTETKTFERIIL